jgi:hypothetical protein
VKTYVDGQIAATNELSEVLAAGNVTGANDIDVDSAQKVQFRDAAIYLNSSVDGQLDIVADGEDSDRHGFSRHQWVTLMYPVQLISAGLFLSQRTLLPV